MYSLSDLLYGFKNPQAAGRELNRLCHTRGKYYRYNPKGTGILQKDWDNLIILDACRHDEFKKTNELSGKTDYRYSLAPATYQFIRANFTDISLLDTVYIGANTWYLKLKDEINSKIFYFVDLQSNKSDIEWADENLKVPTPKTVTRYALRMASKYPHKRLIVHYLQPHHPYLGPTAEDHFIQRSSSLLEVVEESNPSISQLRDAYRETLELVLPEVEKLLNQLKGRTVVTADHGEMLGDRHDYVPIRDYGHHPGIFNDPTTKVPWHVYETSHRPKITSDTPVETDVDEDVINERLRKLGYKL